MIPRAKTPKPLYQVISNCRKQTIGQEYSKCDGHPRITHCLCSKFAQEGCPHGRIVYSASLPKKDAAAALSCIGIILHGINEVSKYVVHN
jgi:hypothetical protein